MAVEQAADRQRVVAHELGVEPEAVLPGQPHVARVLVPRLFRGDRRLPVGVRTDHQREHGLHVPLGADELRRHPVQQFRVTGRRPLRAEVVHVADEALAEGDLPQPIDEHAGRQWVLGRGEPVGQVQSREPVLVRLASHVGLREEARHVRGDDFAAVVLPVAARQHAHHARGRAGRDERLRDGLRQPVPLGRRVGDCLADRRRLRGDHVTVVVEQRLLLGVGALGGFDGQHVRHRLGQALGLLRLRLPLGEAGVVDLGGREVGLGLGDLGVELLKFGL